MFRSFWFYFYSLPFLFSLIILFTPTLNLFPLNPPKFTNAIKYCDDVINDDVYATEYGTIQDACVANFMGEPKIFEPLIILFGILGFLFIVPLSFYIIFSWIRNSYFHK